MSLIWGCFSLSPQSLLLNPHEPGSQYFIPHCRPTKNFRAPIDNSSETSNRLMTPFRKTFLLCIINEEIIQNWFVVSVCNSGNRSRTRSSVKEDAASSRGYTQHKNGSWIGWLHNHGVGSSMICCTIAEFPTSLPNLKAAEPKWLWLKKGQ